MKNYTIIVYNNMSRQYVKVEALNGTEALAMAKASTKGEYYVVLPW